MLGKGHLGSGVAVSSYVIYADINVAPAVLLATGIIAGSVLPDRIEKLGPIRIFPHRGVTHWFMLWLVLCAINLYGVYQEPGQIYLWGTLGLCVGSLVHIMGDMPNYQKIPLLTPTPSFSLGWWKSGQHDILIVVTLFLPHVYLINHAQINLIM